MAMLKPVSILALDDKCTPLAEAVQRRIAATCGLDDLVQVRAVRPDSDLAETIGSIHARRQAPDNPLRIRDDISNRELVLLVAAAAGPASATLLDVARRCRQLYDMRRLAAFYTIEILVLLPDVFPSAAAAEYGEAYSLLKMASAADPQPFDAMWLLDATNANRVRFGHVDEALDAYVEAVVGALTFEPELSGAMPGAFRPRNMHATFSSFGFAELFFPRDAALQRLEARAAAELLRDKLLSDGARLSPVIPQLAAKQFVTGEPFALPMSRIGIESGQSLFRRFQPKTLVSERTRNAEEIIAPVRAELKAYRESTHTKNLEQLAAQGDRTSVELESLLARAVDETLDRDDYASAISLLEALLDPLPDLRAETNAGPRNLVTEITAGTAALDARLRFAPNTTESDAMRKQIRDIDSLLIDQTLVADVLTQLEGVDARAEQLAAMQREKDNLTRKLPDVLFREETENNAARNAARDAEAQRLAEETAARENGLRELFAEKPRAEQTLREVLEERRAYIWKQILLATFGVVALYLIPFIYDGVSLLAIHRVAAIGAGAFAIWATARYYADIGRRLAAARERLVMLAAHIDATDKSKNAAHNDELQFEYDVAHRRTTLGVLRRMREAAMKMADALRTRCAELVELTSSFAPSPIASAGLSVAIIDDADVDGWYDRTRDDRKLLFLEFFDVCVTRSQSRHVPIDELRQRITAYAGGAFESFRNLTLAQIVTGPVRIASEASIAQRLKRLTDYAAPLIEVRDDDLPAQQAMQRDTTLWIDETDAAFLSIVRRRLPDAQLKTPHDPLRVHALSRVLHYPAYVLGQLDYYRAQYDPANYPQSAALADLLPTDLALTGPLRHAYEQVLLGRATGLIGLGSDGQLTRAETALGDSHRTAAEHVVLSTTLREELESALAPRLSIAADIERDLRVLLDARPPLSAMDRELVGNLIRRYTFA
jgi:hypothetical protein